MPRLLRLLHSGRDSLLWMARRCMPVGPTALLLTAPDLQEVPGWQQGLLCDGLHLTPEGNSEVYRLLQVMASCSAGGAAAAAWPAIACEVFLCLQVETL